MKNQAITLALMLSFTTLKASHDGQKRARAFLTQAVSMSAAAWAATKMVTVAKKVSLLRLPHLDSTDEYQARMLLEKHGLDHDHITFRQLSHDGGLAGLAHDNIHDNIIALNPHYCTDPSVVLHEYGHLHHQDSYTMLQQSGIGMTCITLAILAATELVPEEKEVIISIIGIGAIGMFARFLKTQHKEDEWRADRFAIEQMKQYPTSLKALLDAEKSRLAKLIGIGTPERSKTIIDATVEGKLPKLASAIDGYYLRQDPDHMPKATFAQAVYQALQEIKTAKE